MMNYEKANACISCVSGIVGFLMLFFGAAAYIFFIKTWQIVISILGVLLLLFAIYADN